MKSPRELAREEAKAAEYQAFFKMRKTIQADWERSGYDPRGHLQNVQAEGDVGLLVDWIKLEENSRRDTFGYWMAGRSMDEILYSQGWIRYADGRIVNFRADRNLAR
jgi:hypothetical protein